MNCEGDEYPLIRPKMVYENFYCTEITTSLFIYRGRKVGDD